MVCVKIKMFSCKLLGKTFNIKSVGVYFYVLLTKIKINTNIHNQIIHIFKDKHKLNIIKFTWFRSMNFRTAARANSGLANIPFTNQSTGILKKNTQLILFIIIIYMYINHRLFCGT